jgi:hypothetical protein
MCAFRLQELEESFVDKSEKSEAGADSSSELSAPRVLPNVLSHQWQSCHGKLVPP